MLHRTTGILRPTSTVLNRVLNCGFNLLGGACHGGNHGPTSLCLPGNGAEVSTGIEMEPVTLQQLELSKVYCPHCRQQHQMAGIRYWLAEVELFDSTHYEVAKAA